MKSSLVVDMVRAHANGDEVRFREALNSIIRDERSKGNMALSVTLQKAARGSGIRTSAAQPLKAGTAGAEVMLPRYTFDEVFLGADVGRQIDRIISEYDNREMLEARGIPLTNRILLYGPPGCGKTMVAHALADRLCRTVTYVRFDTLVSSYLGQTGANIGELFRSVGQDTVLFLDEFDTIARSRTADFDIGEMKRVVSTLLQSMDAMPDDVLLVAATNLSDQIDGAVLRRFQAAIRMDVPDEAQRESIVSRYITLHIGDLDIDSDSMVELTRGMSGSDLTVLLDSLAKRAVIGNEKEVDSGMVIRTMVELSESEGTGGRYSVLRRLNRNGVPLKALSEATGIPTTTIHYNLKKMEVEDDG